MCADVGAEKNQEFSFSFNYLEGFCDHALYDFRQDSLMAEIMIQRYRMGRTDAISALEESQAAKDAAQRRDFYETSRAATSAVDFLHTAFGFETSISASSAARFMRNVQSVCESNIAEPVCESDDNILDDLASNVSWNSCG